MARERRHDRLTQALRAGYPATLFLSLNIPGDEKNSTGTQALFDWALGAVSDALPGLSILGQESDLLGPCAILALDCDPFAAKKSSIHIEASNPAARLVDLDVYSGTGQQIGRASLGHPARTCLLCAHPAVDCMRLKRHSLSEVISQAHELLAHFTA